ncbi:MAG: ribosome assembly RNA-binding protein YhbY [Firmicutes bacterium]|nr:ribosome assembly RNA-binding protein YhbY [Bacillota bacterium]
MLTGKQKRWLRARAHNLEPIVQVGKHGLVDTLIVALDQALTARELVKVRVLNNCLEPMDEIAHGLSEGTGSELVQKIGHNLVFYRPNPENPILELPGTDRL